jgi:hypothetical protein
VRSIFPVEDDHPDTPSGIERELNRIRFIKDKRQNLESKV